MSQIFVQARTDEELQKLKEVFEGKNFEVKYALDEWRFTPIAIDFGNKRVFNLTSATMCYCMFIEGKKPLLDYCDFETILNFKEN